MVSFFFVAYFSLFAQLSTKQVIRKKEITGHGNVHSCCTLALYRRRWTRS